MIQVFIFIAVLTWCGFQVAALFGGPQPPLELAWVAMVALGWFMEIQRSQTRGSRGSKYPELPDLRQVYPPL